jgi:hypothetical protein
LASVQQRICSAAASLLFLAGALDSPSRGAPANPGRPNLVLDLDGKRHQIPDPKQKATVLVFIATDCPISNSYVPEINRIYEKYSGQDVAMYVVYADANVPREEMKKHHREFSLRPLALADEPRALARTVGATITPEAAILAPDGKLLYRGRIDDTYVALGKRRDQPTQRDLRDSLDAILSGRPVSNRTTKAIGCFIYFGP